MYLHAYGKSGLEIATNTVAFMTEIFPFAICGRVANLRPAFTVKIKGLVMGILPKLLQSRTQSPRAFWPAGERPERLIERLWDNRLHFPRKRGFRSYYVCLSLTGNRKEKTVNSRNGGLKVFEKQEF